MLIEIIDDSSYLTEAQHKLIQEVMMCAVRHLKLGDGIEVDISIVSNEEIQQLNREYRQLDKPTDVLSFALEEQTSEFDVDFAQMFYDLERDDENKEDGSQEEQEAVVLERHLGDIIISYPKAVAQAEEYGHSLERELAFLAVHGFLHLNGYDHQTEDEATRMFALQDEVLTLYGLTR